MTDKSQTSDNPEDPPPSVVRECPRQATETKEGGSVTLPKPPDKVAKKPVSNKLPGADNAA